MNRHLPLFLVLAVLAGVVAAQEKPAGEAVKIDVGAIKAKAEAAWESQNWGEAAVAYKEFLKHEPKNGPAWHHLGYALHTTGKLDDALEAHKKAYEFKGMRAVGAYNAACVYALKKDKDQAFTWLDKAIEAGFGQVEQIEQDSDMDNLRDDPRFKEIEKKIAAAAEKGDGGGVHAFAQTKARRATRLAYFGNGGGAGQIAMDFGPVSWKDDLDKKIEDPKFQGKRWRFGSDAWTRLDTSLDIEIGTAKLTPNDYYVTIERSNSGEFLMTFLDPKEIRKLKLDAFQADKTKGGISTPMKHEKLTTSTKELEVKITAEEGDSSKATLTVNFGPHQLTAPITIRMSN